MNSLSRRLVLSVSAPLLLFFIATSVVLDANFRDLSRSTLEGLQLVVADPSQTEASDSVEEGDVIRMIGKEDGTWLRPGDTVTLVISTGPPLFPVPDLSGKTLAQARDAAAAAGFTISYDEFWDGAPDPFTQVKSQNPNPGEMRVKGTDIALVIGGIF